MGSWKHNSSTRPSDMPGIYHRMLNHFTGSEPELFNSVFQEKLQDVIKTSYEPEEGHRLSDVDVKEIYNFVARNLAACILLHDRDQDRISSYTSLDTQQIMSVAKTLQKMVGKPPSLIIAYEAQFG